MNFMLHNLYNFITQLHYFNLIFIEILRFWFFIFRINFHLMFQFLRKFFLQRKYVLNVRDFFQLNLLSILHQPAQEKPVFAVELEISWAWEFFVQEILGFDGENFWRVCGVRIFDFLMIRDVLQKLLVSAVGPLEVDGWKLIFFGVFRFFGFLPPPPGFEGIFDWDRIISFVLNSVSVRLKLLDVLRYDDQLVNEINLSQVVIKFGDLQIINFIFLALNQRLKNRWQFLVLFSPFFLTLMLT